MAPKKYSKQPLGGKGKASTAQQLKLQQFPLLKNPLEPIGKSISVDGGYWMGNQSAEEKGTMYKCVVRDFEAIHTFGHGPSADKGAAYELQEMGVTGTGSLEHGDASGEIFWMRSPFPFLEYWYKEYPLQPKVEKTPVINLTSPDRGGDVLVLPGSAPDMHPDFPCLRLSKAQVMTCFTINSDQLVEMGKKSGFFLAEFECLIHGSDGRPCGVTRGVYHRRCRAVSTTNLINHIRDAAKTCPMHKAELLKIESASSNFVTIDGDSVAIMNFSEAFR